jgi:hypothetical protein
LRGECDSQESTATGGRGIHQAMDQQHAEGKAGRHEQLDMCRVSEQIRTKRVQECRDPGGARVADEIADEIKRRHQ